MFYKKICIFNSAHKKTLNLRCNNFNFSQIPSYFDQVSFQFFYLYDKVQKAFVKKKQSRP